MGDGGKPLPVEEVEFVLIGAGLPRTGTMSTYTALEMVLPGKCHHMARVAHDKSPRNVDFWLAAVGGGVTDDQWRTFVRDERMSAGVDYPTSLFWKDLIRIYPNAKVLLNDRDPVRWYESVKNTIYNVVDITTKSSLTKYNPLMQLLLRLSGGSRIMQVPASLCYAETPLGPEYPRGMFGVVEEGREAAVRFFKAWKEEVVREVPAERLLVWQVKDGWAPLCQFLGVPVPEEPFPNVNDTPSMQRKLRAMRAMVAGTWAVQAAALAAAAYSWL